MRKKDILFWQSIGQIVYNMDCGSVSGFRAGPLEQERIVSLLSEKVCFKGVSNVFYLGICKKKKHL